MGCCLTATMIDVGTIAFDAVPETIARTTPPPRARRAGQRRARDRVARSWVVLRAGHVDAVGRIESVEAEGEGLRVSWRGPTDALRDRVEKGSITVDGVC